MADLATAKHLRPAAGAEPLGAPRYAFIQALRGPAALVVAWAHLSGMWWWLQHDRSALQDGWGRWVADPLHLYQDGGFLGVLVFFLVSGFVITHASLRETPRSFAIKRVFRIMPPVWVATGLLALLLGAFALFGSHLPAFDHPSQTRWLQALTLTDGFHGSPVLMVTWTLPIEVCFYVLIGLNVGWQARRPLASTVVMTAASLTLCGALLVHPLFRHATNELTLMFLPFLLLGRVLYLWHRRLIPVAAAVPLAVVTGIATPWGIDRFYGGVFLFSEQVPGRQPIFSFVEAVAIFVIAMLWAPRRIWRPLHWLGDISYSLYLVHLPVGLAALTLLSRTGLPNSVQTIVALAVVALAATAMFRWCEKPSIRLAQRLAGGRLRLTVPTDRVPRAA